MFGWLKPKPPSDLEYMAWLVRAVERRVPEWQHIHIRRRADRPEGGVEYYISTKPEKG
jgi:hypothetical protein